MSKETISLNIHVVMKYFSNPKGVFQITGAFLPMMKQQANGIIINIRLNQRRTPAIAPNKALYTSLKGSQFLASLGIAGIVAMIIAFRIIDFVSFIIKSCHQNI